MLWSIMDVWIHTYAMVNNGCVDTQVSICSVYVVSGVSEPMVKCINTEFTLALKFSKFRNIYESVSKKFKFCLL